MPNRRGGTCAATTQTTGTHIYQRGLPCSRTGIFLDPASGQLYCRQHAKVLGLWK